MSDMPAVTRAELRAERDELRIAVAELSVWGAAQRRMLARMYDEGRFPSAEFRNDVIGVLAMPIPPAAMACGIKITP